MFKQRFSYTWPESMEALIAGLWGLSRYDTGITGPKEPILRRVSRVSRGISVPAYTYTS